MKSSIPLSPSVTLSSYVWQASSSSVEHEGDKEVLVKVGECLEKVSNATCTGFPLSAAFVGDCMWFEVGEQAGCSPRTDAFFRMIAAPGKDASDPLYYFFTALADSKCYDQEDEESCSENPGCQWSKESSKTCWSRYRVVLSESVPARVVLCVVRWTACLRVFCGLRCRRGLCPARFWLLRA